MPSTERTATPAVDVLADLDHAATVMLMQLFYAIFISYENGHSLRIFMSATVRSRPDTLTLPVAAPLPDESPLEAVGSDVMDQIAGALRCQQPFIPRLREGPL